MPFLRVLRDKRGYETTYLMHWFREGNRQRSRILYVFRTPPGVRVGRDPIDPAVIREIEAQHPDIQFDWRALRENQQVIDTTPEPRRRKPRRENEKAASEPLAPDAAPVETAQPMTAKREQASQPKLVIPPAIEGTTREEQLVFLLKWYLHLRERVPHRTQDPIRREALSALVERLNPEAWIGQEGIVAGLKDAAEALQRLSTLFSRKRKRSRRGKADRVDAQAPAEAPDTAADDDHASSDEGSESESDVNE